MNNTTPFLLLISLQFLTIPLNCVRIYNNSNGSSISPGFANKNKNDPDIKTQSHNSRTESDRNIEFSVDSERNTNLNDRIPWRGLNMPDNTEKRQNGIDNSEYRQSYPFANSDQIKDLDGNRTGFSNNTSTETALEGNEETTNIILNPTIQNLDINTNSLKNYASNGIKSFNETCNLIHNLITIVPEADKAKDMELLNHHVVLSAFYSECVDNLTKLESFNKDLIIFINNIETAMLKTD